MPAAVIAACVLHNVCLDQNDNFLDYMIEGQEIIEDYQTDPVAPPGAVRKNSLFEKKSRLTFEKLTSYRHAFWF